MVQAWVRAAGIARDAGLVDNLEAAAHGGRAAQRGPRWRERHLLSLICHVRIDSFAFKPKKKKRACTARDGLCCRKGKGVLQQGFQCKLSRIKLSHLGCSGLIFSILVSKGKHS